MSDQEVERIIQAFRRHKPDRKKLPHVQEIIDNGPRRVKRYMDMGAFKPGDKILDVGCAWGAILFGLPDDIEYVGIDVNLPSIKIARDVFGDRGEFFHLDVKAPKYNPDGACLAKDTDIPWGPVFDSVLACSLFTHFTSEAAIRNYLSEIHYCLKRGTGRLLATWFRSPPNESGGDDRRFVYAESTIRELLSDWTWLHDEGGTTTERDDQWHTVVQC